MKDLKAQLDKLIKAARQDNEVLAVFLFGSIARGNNYKTSDIDICLILKDRHYTPLELSKKRVGYLKLFDMDVQIFQQLPLYIRKRILQEGKELFCRDENELYLVAFRAIAEFDDFKHIYYDYLREVESVR
ncbi:MAG: nucleotidyltransferase domain-containing protein [bacterium]|nr:nucleotidyltransferase domain-containing protein [bacterium]